MALLAGLVAVCAELVMERFVVACLVCCAAWSCPALILLQDGQGLLERQLLPLKLMVANGQLNHVLVLRIVDSMS
jgi:hypothetical protein